jgi:hypothetical protein
MAHYYELSINKTAKPMGNKGVWSCYDQETKDFETIKELKAYLSEQYFYVKTKYPTYRDSKDGKAIKSGWVYCFKSDPYSYDDCKHFEQHWISVYEIKSKEITP